MANYWQINTSQEDNTNKTGNATTDGYGQISILLNNYVRKEKGKGLSTNDFTNNLYNKLESCENGSQANKLESLKLNNSTVLYPDANKQINLNVPTKTSQLENDANFAVNAEASAYSDYRDSYVGKSKTAFNDEVNIPIGRNTSATNNGIAIGQNANANNGIAIGKDTETNSTYDINIGNKLKHNSSTDIWDGKTSNSVLADTATSNVNGTPLTLLDTFSSDLSTETYNRQQADLTLQNNINAEALTRSNADNGLSNDINAVGGRVTTIEGMIPNQASSSNQLADKSFVNSSIQTNTANFRGSWATWSDVPTDANDYPADYSGSKTPTSNDYMVVQDASAYALETLSGTWRFKYIGDWDTDGKSGWLPEYQVNEEPFTSEQLYAINSGITSQKVTDYDNHLANTSNPHSVTATQVGLGNVTNVSTIATVTEDSTSNITSGAVYTALQSKMDSSVTHLSGDVPTSREINGKALSADITLDYSDLGAYQTNAVNKDGIVTAPTSSNANKVWKTDGDGNPSWRDEASSNAVLITGDQTIDGIKTFNETIVGTVNNSQTLNSPLLCETSASTADKEINFDGFVLHKHCRCIIDIDNTNTATSALTLNINSTGAKTIILNGSITSATNYNLTSGLYNAYYDGTYWILDSLMDAYRARHCGTISGHTLYL